MIQQYIDIKKQHQDCLLLFRVGDFYELFFEDAKIGAKALEIALTSRDGEDGIPLAGIPFHALDTYLAKLLKKGYKVAICDQVEDPKQAKGIVKREVVKIVTPGTIIDENLLDAKDNNFMCALSCYGNKAGLAFVDNSTGEFFYTEERLNFESINRIIQKYLPSECIVSSDFPLRTQLTRLNLNISNHEVNDTTIKSFDTLLNQTTTHKAGKEAISLLISYLSETQKNSLSHINKIKFIELNKYMNLDYTSIRNLELITTIKENRKKGSLLSIIDKTDSAMGGRKLKQWLLNPLLNSEEIDHRLNMVESLLEDGLLLKSLKELIGKIYDLERLSTKVAYQTVNPKDLVALKHSLQNIPKIKETLISSNSKSLVSLANRLCALDQLVSIIEQGIVPSPPTTIKDGGVIKEGFNSELDELNYTASNGRNFLAEYEENQRNNTGIKSLKVRYNKVFGYYIEVTKTNLSLVPDYYIRKQTLTNAERYFTDELKKYEELILGASEKIVELEYKLFCEIREAVLECIEEIQNNSNVIGELDCLCSFATLAIDNNYRKPELTVGDETSITNGRHPVIEETIDRKNFISNDTVLDCSDNQVLIITGPNMAGKSTYMRQVALITLLAQVGCYVPADEAKISIVDRIFTRVGASDDLSSGQSTFMVEMNELANILKNATSKSLIILDEVGRGTSTFDGMSIAQSAIEYLLDKKKIGAKTLFATHYHQLTSLEDRYKGVKNYSIAVKEENDSITFLHLIKKGGSDRSYGIQVAKLAGVPAPVIQRSNEILKFIEEDFTAKQDSSATQDDIFQVMSQKAQELIEEVNDINLNDITPIEALTVLQKLQNKTKKY
ncbi:DNA mismatch repair protein MutS [Proteinivorax hydrogeniformans]|uniref:DNA mismatch repair protein MutS n=1 Tax=Proteinivorax hydrogeniformans TaxID=1826727 RepID=A0AAU8HXE9_9FIRM